MKKIIFLAALAALALTSCEKLNTVDIYASNDAMDTEIKIQAMMAGDVATKAADAKYATSTNINSFTLGIYAGDDQVALSQFNKPTAPSTIWGDGNIYYWAKDKTYKFYAVARSTGDNATAHNNDYISKDGIKFTDRAITPNEDLIVAYASGTQNTSSVTTNQVTELTFYHALARVRVAAKFSATEKTNIKAKFVKWELKNVATTGSVTIDGTSTGKTTSDVVWTSSATKVSVTDDQASTTTSAYLDSDYRIVTGDKVADGQEKINTRWVNVIPNATVKADELIATVEFYTTEGNLIATRKLHAKVGGTPALTYADGFAYKSGKAYTYKIDIKDDGGNSTDSTDDPNDLDKYKIEVTDIKVTEWSGVTGGTAKFE